MGYVRRPQRWSVQVRGVSLRLDLADTSFLSQRASPEAAHAWIPGKCAQMEDLEWKGRVGQGHVCVQLGAEYRCVPRPMSLGLLLRLRFLCRCRGRGVRRLRIGRLQGNSAGAWLPTSNLGLLPTCYSTDLARAESV